MGLLLIMTSGCAQEGPESTQVLPAASSQVSDDDRILQAELVVARDLLRQAPSGGVLVDSMYAVAGQAPGPPSPEMRPASRTRLLSDSLAVTRRSGQAIVLRLSKPESSSDRVRITATIDYPMDWQSSGRGYETVEYSLEHRGGTWTIRTRVQLGVT